MTSIVKSDIPENIIDIRALSSLITELNIARRNFKSYPKEHPVVKAGFLKVITIYNSLLENRDEISIGVAKESLMFGSTVLEKTNPVFRDFARILFEHCIGVLTLKRGLTADELRSFNVILGLKRDEMNRHGGIEALWEKGRISSLAIKAIRYDLFTAASEDRNDGDEPDTGGGIWERFARCLMTDGACGPGEQTGVEVEPEILATMLNNRFTDAAADSGESGAVFESVIDVMHQAGVLHRLGSSDNHAFGKLGVFVSKLNPDLRRQFLGSTFDARGKKSSLAEDIIQSMPADAVLETLDDLNLHKVDIPPVIMGLLQKLSTHASGDRSGSSMTELSEDELRERMRTIFREHASEEFIPDDYQAKLNLIIHENQIPLMTSSDQELLLATLDSSLVENRISDIIMNMIMDGGETPEDREFFLQNLSDMFGYFLQTGDYGQLIKMIDQSKSDAFPIEIQYYLRENYARREFLDEILNGLNIWGKPRYKDIQQLVTKIGSPFIEVLLDHLATEENLSLRRFLIDRLIEMGHMTKVPVCNRLSDERWFVLRNLIIILRGLNDQSIIPLIRPLSRHSNNRVRNEALTTLVMLNDPAAEKQIIRDLDSSDREVQFAAIALAEKSHFPDVHKKLLAILTRSGLSQTEYELKNAVVRTLGELRRNETLPEFARILGSTSLFNSKLLTRHKIDILKALEHYPFHAVAPLLERIGSGKDEVARQAQESMKICKAKSNDR